MHSRRSVLATSGAAIAATLAGCNVLNGGGAGDDDPRARRWLTGEVARIPYEDPSDLDGGREHPPVRNLTTGRPSRARTIDGLSELGMQYAAGRETFDETSLQMEAMDEVTSLFGERIEIGIGEFDAPAPPDDATEAGSHRDVSLFVMQHPSSRALYNGIAIDDGVYVRVRPRPSADAAEAALRSVLDAEAGDGTPIEGDDVGRIWSFIGEGFYVFYSEISGRGRAGVSLRADGDSVRRRAMAVRTSEAAAEQHQQSVEAGIEDSNSGDDERSLNDFSPYEEVSVDRDGRAVMIEGSLSPADVSHPEFTIP